MTSTQSSPAPTVPPGLRIYAIGDMHGRADLLRTLLATIEADAARHPSVVKRMVFLGDYVDRGPQSKELIDLVLDAAPPRMEVVTLMGNHEEMMQRFLSDTSVGRSWMVNGGDATLASYGVKPPSLFATDARYRQAQMEFRDRIPDRHLRFLESLVTSYTAGDYLFVHAGVRPQIPLELQRPDDLLWIRDEFLRSEADFGKVVVHGHSIVREPEMRRNRIAIDTGAYATGRLTCLVLEGTAKELLAT
ncbi:MAG TPA: metallophosphoesterase family protein [Stellaceae bacterium]|nr:metallophosphoesterase family protein [Stellaceae bacterium]